MRLQTFILDFQYLRQAQIILLVGNISLFCSLKRWKLPSANIFKRLQIQWIKGDYIYCWWLKMFSDDSD